VIPLSRVRLTLCQRLVNRVRQRLLARRRQRTIRSMRCAAASAPEDGVAVVESEDGVVAVEPEDGVAAAGAPEDGVVVESEDGVAAVEPEDGVAAAGASEDGVVVESAVVAAVDAELQCLRQLDETFVPYEVDDKFDLPPIVALVIAFLYTLLGAWIYTRWEQWSYFEAFYFTFISLCTIGFGDVVPEHPKNLMATSVYLLFGLALIAMVVTVVMEAVDSTIARAKDGVVDVGRRLVDVAQRQTFISVEQQVAPDTQRPLSAAAAAASWSNNRRHSI